MHQDIREFQIAVHNSLFFDFLQTKHYLPQNELCLIFAKVATPSPNETFQVTTIAVLHYQIVVTRCLCCGYQRDYIVRSDFLHNTDLVMKQLGRVPLQTLPLNYFDSVNNVWAAALVPKMHSSVLALAKYFW